MFNVFYCLVKSYVLGEIPSLKDRITIVRQLWDLTRDVLVKNFFMTSFMSPCPCLCGLVGFDDKQQCFVFPGKIYECLHFIGHSNTSCVFIDIISTTKEFLSALVSACSVSGLPDSFLEKWRSDHDLITLL